MNNDLCYCEECGELFNLDETIKGDNKKYETVRMCWNCFEEAEYCRKQEEQETLNKLEDE